MTTREMSITLGSVRSFRRTASKIHIRIDELRAGLYPSGIRYDRDKVQTTPLDQMLEAFSQIDSLERNLNQLDKEIEYHSNRIEKLTVRLPYKERFVLNAYYVECASIRDISNIMEITERHVLRLKQNGISMLCESEGSKNA